VNVAIEKHRRDDGRKVLTSRHLVNAPTFVNPEQVRFRYKLAGLSEEWVDAGGRRSVSFCRVPPGNLHVRPLGFESHRRAERQRAGAQHGRPSAVLG
jgi:hypothetical protein